MSVEFVQQAIELRALSGALVRTLLPFGECVDAVQQAVRGVSAGKVVMPRGSSIATRSNSASAPTRNSSGTGSSAVPGTATDSRTVSVARRARRLALALARPAMQVLRLWHVGVAQVLLARRQP